MTGSDPILCFGRVSAALGPGAAAAASASCRAPRTVGTHYIGVLVDAIDEYPEGDELNNIASAPTPMTVVEPQPDFTAGTITCPSTVELSEFFRCTLEVTNTGTGPSDRAVLIGMYLSSDATVTTADLMLSDCLIGSLALGESDTTDCGGNVPDTRSPGDYYIGMIADHEDRFTEPDETDNTAVTMMTVTGRSLP